MPIGEIETHPYLIQGQINRATKLILGSFPVYECTDQDNRLKQRNRLNEGTVRFFYGSNRNSLWTKYSQFIDNTINQPWNPNLILNSLEKRKIAVSDLIKSCERCSYKKNKRTGEKIAFPYSSEDSALRKKTWNREIVSQLLLNGVTKIICTSKGVLSDLEKQIICYNRNPLGIKDNDLSMTFQSEFINEIGGNTNEIKNDIGKVFIVENRKILAIAIPSPGSPQRQTHTFGCGEQERLIYAERYFEKAFNWLTE
ncbi:hypothetical protein DFQ09_1163 [Winogradskyella pacifica]|uniref:Uncharacterized protein n=1 Tax=Winogradskyella pacifica TaxID=664642 RepID=A0A3D9LJS1_9FLAO|nr:hypothetical protein [Winogradskyella pacifica]REE07629.1 hypothetical protein DFQ09_1163 [Winogradskyella pacifica]